MRTAIYDLLYSKKGNINTIKFSKEYAKAEAEYNACYDKLEATLTKDQREMLDELYSLGGGVLSEAQATFYEEGFRMGIRLLTEALK